MFALVLARAAVMAVCLSAAFGLTACAPATSEYSSPSPAVASYVARSDAIDIEDDGLPAQSPPPMHLRHRPDDPSEPFSRNYGGTNPASAAKQNGDANQPDASQTATVVPDAAYPYIPSDLPPAFRRQLAAAMDQAE
jgi:hypothetical protein